MNRIKIGESTAAPELETQPAPLEQARLWRADSENGSVPGWPAIFITQEAYRQINAHAESDMSHEVGGMLIGYARQTPEGQPYVIVEAQLPAQHVDQGPAHLTFTSDTLTDLLNRQEDLYPDMRVVGWFHTHPGLSVFLSSYDVWLHTNFFPKPWHVALVIDPVANRAGFFRYAQGQADALDPRNYVGFYELHDAGDRFSAVEWINLSPG